LRHRPLSGMPPPPVTAVVVPTHAGPVAGGGPAASTPPSRGTGSPGGSGSDWSPATRPDGRPVRLGALSQLSPLEQSRVQALMGRLLTGGGGAAGAGAGAGTAGTDGAAAPTVAGDNAGPSRDRVPSIGTDECSICFNLLYTETCACEGRDGGRRGAEGWGEVGRGGRVGCHPTSAPRRLFPPLPPACRKRLYGRVATPLLPTPTPDIRGRLYGRVATPLLPSPTPDIRGRLPACGCWVCGRSCMCGWVPDPWCAQPHRLPTQVLHAKRRRRQVGQGKARPPLPPLRAVAARPRGAMWGFPSALSARASAGTGFTSTAYVRPVRARARWELHRMRGLPLLMHVRARVRACGMCGVAPTWPCVSAVVLSLFCYP
jgi:hypothetical protein